MAGLTASVGCLTQTTVSRYCRNANISSYQSFDFRAKRHKTTFELERGSYHDTNTLLHRLSGSRMGGGGGGGGGGRW